MSSPTGEFALGPVVLLLAAVLGVVVGSLVYRGERVGGIRACLVGAIVASTTIAVAYATWVGPVGRERLLLAPSAGGAACLAIAAILVAPSAIEAIRALRAAARRGQREQSPYRASIARPEGAPRSARALRHTAFNVALATIGLGQLLLALKLDGRLEAALRGRPVLHEDMVAAVNELTLRHDPEAQRRLVAGGARGVAAIAEALGTCSTPPDTHRQLETDDTCTSRHLSPLFVPLGLIGGTRARTELARWVTRSPVIADVSAQAALGLWLAGDPRDAPILAASAARLEPGATEPALREALSLARELGRNRFALLSRAPREWWKALALPWRAPLVAVVTDPPSLELGEGPAGEYVREDWPQLSLDLDNRKPGRVRMRVFALAFLFDPDARVRVGACEAFRTIPGRAAERHDAACSNLAGADAATWNGVAERVARDVAFP